MTHRHSQACSASVIVTVLSPFQISGIGIVVSIVTGSALVKGSSVQVVHDDGGPDTFEVLVDDSAFLESSEFIWRLPQFDCLNSMLSQHTYVRTRKKSCQVINYLRKVISHEWKNSPHTHKNSYQPNHPISQSAKVDLSFYVFFLKMGILLIDFHS